MRSLLLGATMLCALSTMPAYAQRMRPLPLITPTPTPTATPTPTPSPTLIRRLPVRQSTPAAAPAPTPSPTPARGFVQPRQSAPAPTPTPEPLVTRTPRTPVRDQTPTGPVSTPQQVLNRPIQVKPPVVGSPHVDIIDPGYAETDHYGAREVQFDACLTDKNGTPVDVQDMHYTVSLPGGDRKGEMQGYFQPSKAPTYKSAGVKGASVTHCRRGSFKLKPCEVPAGEYPLTVDAQPASYAPVSAKGSTILGGYSTTIVLKAPGPFEAGLPQKVSGNVYANCDAEVGADVTVAAENGEPLQFKIGKDGSFAGNYTFTAPGKATLRAVVNSSDSAIWSEAQQPVNVAAPPVIATILNQPKLAKLGVPVVFAARLRHATSGVPMAGASASFAFGKQLCKGVAAKDGTFSCAVTIPTSETIQIGKTPDLILTVSNVSNLTNQGLGETRIVDSNGLVTQFMEAWLGQSLLDDAQPGGVLLQSYNPGWHGTGAHLDNGSLMYPKKDFSGAQKFDIKTFNGGGFSYYLDGVMIRTGTLQPQSPARIRIPLSVTSSLEGRGPRLKGFCFEWYCKPIGYDNFAPDVNDIKLNNGYVSIDLYVENGHVKARLGPMEGTLDFSCGGITSVICGLARDVANSELQKRLGTMMGNSAMLAVASANLDQQVQAKLKDWNMASLVSISFAPDGSITAVGTPLLK